MKKRNKQAFTLIEIVIFITVLGLFTGLAGVRLLNQSTEYDLIIKQLHINLLYAQQAAMNSSALIGYQFDEQNQSYQGIYIARGNTPNPFPRENFMFALKTEQMTTNAPKDQMLFGRHGALVDEKGEKLDSQVSVELQYNNKTVRIYIEPGSGWIHL